MSREIGSVVLLLLGLATAGVVLAGVGTAMGVTDPLTDDRSGTEFRIGDDDVTVTDDDETVTLADDMSNVMTVELEETEAGRFELTLEREEPFTEREREQAIELARENETIQRYLDGRDDYDITFQPISQADTSVSRWNVTSTANESEEIHVTVEDDSTDTVRVTRDPAYVEDRATVWIRPGLDDSPTYIAEIDMENGIVVDVDGWE